jgi:hypothetical protein
MKYFVTVLVLLIATITAASAAEMPKEFQGTWCSTSLTLKGDWRAHDLEHGCDSDDRRPAEITAAKVNIPALSISCVVRQVTHFDYCPYGMIFRNRERAQALRSFQIDDGYHIVLQCMSGSKFETIEGDWAMERAWLVGGTRSIPRRYRCPWDRKGK